jgi:hypothetical protein
VNFEIDREERGVTKEIRELSPPPDVREQGGVEVLRAFVVGQALSVSLQRAFEDPSVWGMLFADVARQIASIYGRESEIEPDQALDMIRDAFARGLDAADDSQPRH